MFFLDQYIQKWAIRVFYLLFLIFIFLRLFIFDTLFFDRAVSYAAYPFLQAHSLVCDSIDSTKKKFQSLHDLKVELSAEKKRREWLDSRVVELEQTALFHERTKDIVSFSERYDESFYLLAKILMRKQNAQEYILFLDVGSKKGIIENMIVVYKNNLVGRVIQVYPLYSEVAFILDSRCKITAETSQGNIEGMYEGQNKDRALLKFIPHFIEIKVGTRIYSAGKGLLYPQGFLLGTVDHVKQGSIDQEISIEPTIDFNRLEYVHIIKN
jgi:rod shape-determining protein MreC